MPPPAALASQKAASAKSELRLAPVNVTIPLDLTWVDTCTVPMASQYPRPLLVANFCPGICGGMHAFNFLGVPESVRYLCDVWGALEKPLQFNVPRGDRVHVKCGKKNGGDVTAIDCISLDPVDIFTAGPPCPPWSSLGSGNTTEDPRSEVFNAVVECVKHFGKMGLKVFLLENVLGVLKSWKGGPIFMRELLKHFMKEMPWFEYRLEVTNSKHHGLPQNRPRVFLIGYHRHLAPATPGLDQPLFTPMQQASLYNLLAKGCPKLDVQEHLTPNECECVLRGYLPLLQEQLWNPDYKGKAAIFDISRNPEKKFGAFFRADDLTMTLTCGNGSLVVMSLGEGMDFKELSVGEDLVPSTDPGSKPEIFRLLYTEERLRCHGFPHNADHGLRVPQSIKASGNAYSVNTVGRVLAPFVKALIDTDALSKVPLIKPAGSAKGQTNLGAWLRKTAPPEPWTEVSKENFHDESRFQRFINSTPLVEEARWTRISDALVEEAAWDEAEETELEDEETEQEDEVQPSATASAAPAVQPSPAASAASAAAAAAPYSLKRRRTV